MQADKLYGIIADIIAKKREAHQVPQAASWIEIYTNVGAFDISAEQMQRELNRLVKAGRIQRSRCLNYDLYYLEKPNDNEDDTRE